jgi:3-hydroxyacyl-CoA dehydrogenase
MMSLRKIVVLGTGTMGAGAAAVFASAGIPTVLVGRTIAKAEAGRARAEALAKGKVAPRSIALCSYEQDLDHAIRDADLVLEAIVEDLESKCDVLALIDHLRAPGSIVATVSSGLPIGGLCSELSDDFRRHFLGIHLFNPPTAITGCELIPHLSTDPDVVQEVREMLETQLGRVVVECSDKPAFAGNRIGFKVLNEIAQLAEIHGVAYMDQLVGTHTGRALSPLATIDLVGWDVHAAIVDNLWERTHDEAHAAFALPGYLRRGIAQGRLGRKTRDKGGFYRIEGKGDHAIHFVLDPARGDYRPLEEVTPPMPAFIERMRASIRAGDHPEAFDVLCRTPGSDAELLRRILLGYVSYALGRVGDVVETARDVDRIMGFGFNWAPPSVIVDAIGAQRTIELLSAANLPVPRVIVRAATTGRKLFDEPSIDSARFFIAA